MFIALVIGARPSPYYSGPLVRPIRPALSTTMSDGRERQEPETLSGKHSANNSQQQINTFEAGTAAQTTSEPVRYDATGQLTYMTSQPGLNVEVI